MTKEVFTLRIDDVSAFARSLGQALVQRHADTPKPPGQVELLNLIARTQGQRNWQALRQALRPASRQAPVTPGSMGTGTDDDLAAGAAFDPASTTGPATLAESPEAPRLSENARKALAHFDQHGRLMRWPVKFSVQKLVMWVLWTRFDAKRSYTEGEVNTILKAANMFFDHVTLRRELVNHQLMARRSDGSDYRKLPARPDDETRALLGAWRARYRER
jgi:hypothetical protein